MKHTLAILSLTLLGVLLYNAAYFLPQQIQPVAQDVEQQKSMESRGSTQEHANADTVETAKPRNEDKPEGTETLEASVRSTDIYENIMQSIAGSRR